MEAKNFNPLRAIAKWLEKREEANKEKILSALGEGELSGGQISVKTGLSSGTLFPLLFKMERKGILTSRWSWPVPIPGRSRIQFYKKASSEQK